MSIIHYKYNVGDYVKFKSKFTNPSCGLVRRAGRVAKITGRAFSYNDRPHYYINNVEDEVFPESVFTGLATESEFLEQISLNTEVDTLQGPEAKCDTRDSSEFEVLPLEEAKRKMKRYFLIRTSDNEYNSSYKKICETLEEAKKEVPNFANWWYPKGTCDIHEVDENFVTYKVYEFVNGCPAGIRVWKEG